MDLVFVYGTLRSAVAHAMHELLATETDFVSAGTARGVLYDLGNYPGMVALPDATTTVRGEVYRLRTQSASRTLRTLDEYEGCAPGDPEPHEYHRARIPVTLDNGETVDSWAYLLNRDAQGLRRIPSGNYLARETTTPRVVAERPPDER